MKYVFAFLLIIFVMTRLATANIFNIHPDVSDIFTHWQNLSIPSLRDNLLYELINLHSQPPLWNTILGISAKACDGNVGCISKGIHLFFMTLTFMTTLMIASFLIQIGLPKTIAATISAIYAILPSTIFYENYVFYPHFTMYLCSSSVYFFYAWIIKNRTFDYLLFLVAMVLLSMTWALMHPLVISIAVLVITLKFGKISPQSLIPAFVAIFIICTPATKNFYMFGFFGNSSWLGLNLSQVDESPSPACSFDNLRAGFDKDVHTGELLNNVSIIPISEICKEQAIKNIISNPQNYIFGRIRAFALSSVKSSADYSFSPVGFERYPRIKGYEGTRKENETYNYSSIFRGISYLVLNSLGYISLIYFSFRGTKEVRAAACFGIFFVAMVIGLGHAVNGSEQERFRHTISPFMFLSTLSASWILLSRLTRGRLARPLQGH
ncbi:hypothetical protein OAS86_04925 [Gammaproteobacteria bacterium]|nr:hypothetical protein [Gammaproteobacteria bacterium]